MWPNQGTRVYKCCIPLKGTTAATIPTNHLDLPTTCSTVIHINIFNGPFYTYQSNIETMVKQWKVLQELLIARNCVLNYSVWTGLQYKTVQEYSAVGKALSAHIFRNSKVVKLDVVVFSFTNSIFVIDVVSVANEQNYSKKTKRKTF